MPLTIGQAAKHIGVHPTTLKRWMKAGKIPEVSRDRNGWYVFEEEDIQVALKYANKRISASRKNGQGASESGKS